VKRLTVLAGLVVAAASLAIAPLAFSGHRTKAGGLPVLIKTKMRVIIPAGDQPPTRATGQVRGGSFFGDREFCRGGSVTQAISGAPPNVTVTALFRCKEGRLRIRFKPRGPSPEARSQSGLWTVVGGTGRYGNVRPGHGSIFTRFDRCCPTFRETYIGTLANR
jgi:hypothetical protein